MDTLLTFEPNSTESCVGINIINDIAIEQVVSFIVTLEAPADLDDRVSLSPAQGSVTIIDDDGESYSAWYGKVCTYVTQ